MEKMKSRQLVAFMTGTDALATSTTIVAIFQAEDPKAQESQNHGGTWETSGD